MPFLPCSLPSHEAGTRSSPRFFPRTPWLPVSFATCSMWLQGDDAWNLGLRCLPQPSTHWPQPQIPVWLPGHTLGAGFQGRKLSSPSCLRLLLLVTVHPVELRWTAQKRQGKLQATHDQAGGNMDQAETCSTQPPSHCFYL